MELTAQDKRVNQSFRLVKFNGTRIKDMSDSAIKKLCLFNSNQTRLPIWDKNRINRIPDRVEVAARRELKLRGYKVIGLRIETITNL